MEQSKVHWDLTERIIRIFYQVHAELGAGHLESVYANAMAIALHEDGIAFAREVPIAVFFRGHRVGFFRADKFVANAVILEYKAGDRLEPSWEEKLLNYLRNSEIEVGLLLFFGPQPTIKRRHYSNTRKVLRSEVRRVGP